MRALTPARLPVCHGWTRILDDRWSLSSMDFSNARGVKENSSERVNSTSCRFEEATNEMPSFVVIGRQALRIWGMASTSLAGNVY